IVPAGEADDGEAVRQQLIDRQVVKRGDELAVRKVAGGAQDDHGAWLGRAALLHTLPQWVLDGGRHASALRWCPCHVLPSRLSARDTTFSTVSPKCWAMSFMGALAPK